MARVRREMIEGAREALRASVLEVVGMYPDYASAFEPLLGAIDAGLPVECRGYEIGLTPAMGQFLLHGDGTPELLDEVRR